MYLPMPKIWLSVVAVVVPVLGLLAVSHTLIFLNRFSIYFYGSDSSSTKVVEMSISGKYEISSDFQNPYWSRGSRLTITGCCKVGHII